MAMSPDERREKNAQRMRTKRAAAREARDAEKAASKPADPAAIPPVMRDAIAEALSHMKWLQPSDAASIAQAKQLADDIDRFHHEEEHAKALSAHRALSRVLNDLGGTPNMRLARELRSLRHVTGKPEGDDGSPNPTEGQQPDNVTKFKRPPKRRA